MSIKLVKGSVLPVIKVTLLDRNTGDYHKPETWAALILTGTTVTLSVRKAGDSAVIDTVTATFPNNGSDGRVEFKLTNTIVDTAFGDYEGEINIDYGAGDNLTVYGLLKFYFRA